MELNSLNIADYKTEILKEKEKHDLLNQINDFENNFELKVSLVNIDSSFRNRIPYNIIDLKTKLLDDNPIIVKENSDIVKIKIPNHNFNTGDNIIIENITGKEYILTNAIYLVNNFNYCLIKLENHNYNNITNINEIDTVINITSYDNFDNNYRLLGSIPINSIFGYQQVFTFNEIEINDLILEEILNNLNIDSATFQNNYLFIKLPFAYSKNNKLNNGIVFTDFYNFESIIRINFLNIGGIPLQYINANYPIDYNKYQYKQYIYKTDTDYIYFKSKVKANYDDVSGGSNIIIGKIIKSIDGYPNANNYVLELKKSFTDVVRIELLTTEIPFIEFNVKNNVDIKNNKIYWKYLEDGDYIYETSIDEGNYTTDSIIDALTSKMNSILRINSTTELKIYNLFEIEINKNSQEVNFIAYKLESLPNSLSLELDENLNGAFKLTITHTNNFVNVGDTITISDSTAIGDIGATLINTDHIVYEVNTFNNTYSVIISQDISITDINISGNGGPNVKIKIPAKASFLFNYSDTIGSLLGFKNPGSPNSITPFLHKTSNFNNYVLPNIYDELGSTQISNNLLNLTNNYYYMMMFLNNYEGIVTSSHMDQANIFSKILMSGNIGDVMFNTFVNSPLEFDVPISTISQFSIKFFFPDGTRPDFRNFNHSFTLRIVEKISKPHMTGIESTKQNYMDAIVMN